MRLCLPGSCQIVCRRLGGLRAQIFWAHYHGNGQCLRGCLLLSLWPRRMSRGSQNHFNETRWAFQFRAWFLPSEVWTKVRWNWLRGGGERCVASRLHSHQWASLGPLWLWVTPHSIVGMSASEACEVGANDWWMSLVAIMYQKKLWK